MTTGPDQPIPTERERLLLEAQRLAGLGFFRLVLATQQYTWSEEMYRLYDYPPGEPMDVGKHRARVHPDDLPSVMRLQGEMLGGRDPLHYEYRIIDRTGDVRHLVAHMKVQRDATGAPEAIIGTVQDITTHKRQEELLYEAQAIARLGSWEFDFVTGRASWSDEYYRLCGYEPQAFEITRETFQALLHPDDFPRIWYGMMQLAKRPGAFEADYRVRRPDGFEVILVSRGRVLQDANGKGRRIVGTVQDVTAERASQEALRRTSEEAQEANRAKSMFLANMSHELRTPLNAIIGYAEMLQEAASEMTTDEITADLDKIRKSGRHLLALINDILDLSKIEAGKMALELETVRVGPLLAEIAEAFGALTLPRGNRLELDVPPGLPTLCTDATKLRQCVLNLLANANKFTQRGRIRLAAEQADERVRIRVADTGIGMDAETQSRLFQPFVQADPSTTRKYGGTGLGLAITQRFCQLMGGDVTVDSVPGQGATFTITLPVGGPP
jgi:PAS domain S-box-containing protein